MKRCFAAVLHIFRVMGLPTWMQTITGQVPGDRRCYLPGQTQLPGPGQALAARLDGTVMLTAALQRVSDRRISPHLEAARAGPHGRLPRAFQFHDRIFALTGLEGSQRHLSFGQVLLVAKSAG